MKEDHGERQEFAALVQAHSRALFRAARALLDSDAAAEDAVGEAVLLAWQAFPRLRRRESARAWLLKITVNCAYDQRRRARPTVPLEEAACAAAPAQEPLGLWELVQALPEEQRLAVTLYACPGAGTSCGSVCERRVSMSFDPWDRELRERAQREDCPIPEGFSTRLEEQLERLPERSGGRKWGKRRILVLLAAALALTACTAGTVSIALRQNTIRQVKNEGAGRWEVIKAEEAGEPTPEVHVRENLPRDYEPVPLEQVLENMSQLGYSLVSREQGGPEDDWRERCIWEDSQTETQTVFYWADSMADLESFWPEVVPHAFWLDGQYTPSPMGMSYGYDADLATGEVWGRYFSGEYTGEDGAAFEFGFTYNARYTWPDWYSVDLTGQEYQEQYETKDGAVVSIEIIPSVTGKSVFYTAISTEHTLCTLHGTQMELEESRDILDHLELSQLLTYQPEPTE